MSGWNPEVLDVRGNGYGFVTDQAETARAVFSYGYPNPGLNISAGNWGPLNDSQLQAARKFVEAKFTRPPQRRGRK